MSGKRATIASCLFLCAVTLAVYLPVRNHPFLNYDDWEYVTKNPHVRAGLTHNTFAWAWTATEAYNWHPLTWLSHALDCQLYGLNPAGHHLTSVLLHCLNVLLLFLVLLHATGRCGRSLVAAALFALHPFNVESVAWIAERKNLLSTTFFLLALSAYVWYAAKPTVNRYLTIAFLFALGLAAKPMVITLPFVLLLLDFWPLERIEGWSAQPSPPPPKRKVKAQAQMLAPGTRFTAAQAPLRRLVSEKVPLLLMSAASAVVTVIAQRSGGAVRSLEKIPLPVRLANAVYSYARYAWKTVWPSGFALYYPHPSHHLAAWRLGVAALFLLAATALVWNQRMRRRYLVTGWLWYLGTLVPVIGIVQVGDQAMADRYAYIPLIGIFVLVVWSAADGADAAKIGLPWRATAAGIVLAVLAFLTWRQIGYWKSNADLWAHTLHVTGGNPLAEAELGDALHALDRPEEALPHFQRAAQMQPREPKHHVDLAEDLAECGRLREAIPEYEAAIQLTSDAEKRARSYQSLAILHGALGEYAETREAYRQALSADPQLEEEMTRSLSDGVAQTSTGQGYLVLGILLQEAGRTADARAAYEKALSLDPSLEDARHSLDALSASGR